uniref:Uncharacterized protein n=1 Tax=Cyanoderma ruficeps TaxID=181631 RepID=A0A8C3QMY2_9PASS
CFKFLLMCGRSFAGEAGEQEVREEPSGVQISRESPRRCGRSPQVREEPAAAQVSRSPRRSPQVREEPAGEQDVQEGPAGEQEEPAGEQDVQEGPAGKQEEPAGEQGVQEEPAGEQGVQEEPAGEQEKPSGEQDVQEEPAGEQGVQEEPAGEQEKPSGEQDVQGEPAGERAVALSPAVMTHESQVGAVSFPSGQQSHCLMKLYHGEPQQCVWQGFPLFPHIGSKQHLDPRVIIAKMQVLPSLVCAKKCCEESALFSESEKWHVWSGSENAGPVQICRGVGGPSLSVNNCKGERRRDW